MMQPPFLQAGDTIGICCPSGSLSLETIQPMITQLEFWGFEVKIGNTVGSTFHKYSGTDKERLTDFQSMLNDDSVKAILFGRGGYGFVRIIDAIDFTAFKKNPKWLVGYSDITVLHNHVNTQLQIATLHAHMSGGYTADSFDNDSTMSIYHALTGKPCKYTIATNATNETSICNGELVGGNLSLLVSMIGTPSDINTKGKILFLEDIGEYPYHIDRMMWQLLRAGKLDHLAGLIVGGFTDAKVDSTPFGKTEYEIIWEKASLYNYPVCFGFPVGHQPKNVALKIGVNHRLQIETNQIILEEIITV